jgi:hypothetical protein
MIDLESIGTEEVLEKLRPLLEDRYLDKVVSSAVGLVVNWLENLLKTFSRAEGFRP